MQARRWRLQGRDDNGPPSHEDAPAYPGPKDTQNVFATASQGSACPTGPLLSFPFIKGMMKMPLLWQLWLMLLEEAKAARVSTAKWKCGKDELMTLPRGEYRKNPPGMLRDVRKIDLIKTLKNKFGARVRGLFQQFPDTLPVGSPASDFTLQTVSGEKASLSDYRGKKHVVLEFGSFT